jgi:hypothetical protein
MATGRIRRTARRGIAAAVLGWLGVAAVSVLLAPSASAAPSVTVVIRDLTPPVASVDPGGTVTFVNDIAPKTVQVGGGGLLPSLVNVTATTEVTLSLPSGDKKLPRGASVSERFNATCATCAITYTYQLSSGTSLTAQLTQQALGLLPPLPARTPFVVQTIAPAVPNLPSVNVPQLPTVTVPNPLPNGAVPPAGSPLPGPEGPAGPVGSQPGSPQGFDGTPYSYGTGGGPGVAPVDRAAAAAFDPARFGGPVGNRGSSGGSSSGSGGLTGGYDGASVPVFGELAGLDGSNLDEESETSASPGGTGQTLPVAALVAVVALAAVTAALVRTHQAQRGTR